MSTGGDAGAEAVVTETEYLGLPSVTKTRAVKGYRHPELDRGLRTHRTRNEVRVMREARRAGVRTPAVYDVDMCQCAITMERADGEKVRDIIDAHPEMLPGICDAIGTSVGRMHRARICHGDLTTSNMFLSKDGELCIFDFSLGSVRADVEMMGVDLHLLERALTSAHSEHPEAYAMILESYRREMPDAEAVISRVETIKKRARYT